MENEVIQQAIQTGQDVANYGFTGALSVLCLAVVFLYKQINVMNQKIQDLIVGYAKDLRDLTTSLQSTIENNAKTFEECRKAIDEFKILILNRDK